MEKMVGVAGNRKIGDPFAEDTAQGPITTEKQYQKIMGYIESGKSQGADVLYDGNGVIDRKEKGYFVGNVIFGNVKDEMVVAKEEIFGPVMQIMKFKDTEEVLKRANNTPYGLAAMVFSDNLNTVNHASRALKAGTIWVNCYGV